MPMVTDKNIKDLELFNFSLSIVNMKKADRNVKIQLGRDQIQKLKQKFL